MKAIVWTKYGPPEVLQYKEVAKPVPKDNEILIKIHSATVTAGDCEVRRMQVPLGFGVLLRMIIGLTQPRRRTILGTEVAGEIDAVGKDVKLFQKGDTVFGSTGFVFGAYAEYVCVPEDAVIIKKPSTITFDEAATVSIGGLESLHFLRMANVKPGEKILINGAGGSIGTYGVQFAKHFGAEVTAVDSYGKLAMLKKIGADNVIDYKEEDFTKRDETYDIIFDVVGKSHYKRSLKILNDGGRYIIANPRFSILIRKRFTLKKGGKRIITKFADYKSEDLIFIIDLMVAGKVKSVIDKRFSLDQVPEAHRYVETGQKKGNVVITVRQANK
jgi:NADPH:quinone reductase-like Zn-dependent oxidoreductase